MKLVAASFGQSHRQAQVYCQWTAGWLKNIKSQILISADEDRRQIYTTGSNAAAGDVAAV